MRIACTLILTLFCALAFANDVDYSGGNNSLSGNTVTNAYLLNNAVLTVNGQAATLKTLYGGSLSRLQINSGDILTLNDSGTSIFQGTLAGDGSIVLDKSIWTLSGDNKSSWIGNILVNSDSTLVAASGNALGDRDSASVELDGGTLGAAANSALGHLVMSGNGTLQIIDSVTFYLNNITGTGQINKIGNGYLYLYGNNDANFSGGIKHSEGAIFLQKGATLGSGTFVSEKKSTNDETTRLLGFLFDDPSSPTASDNFVLDNDFEINDVLTLYINSSDLGSVTLNGNISGSGDLSKYGYGTLILEGNDKEYSGKLTVASGVLQLNAKMDSAHIVLKSGTALLANSNSSAKDLTMEAGSLLSVRVGEKISVGGTATLNSGIIFVEGLNLGRSSGDFDILSAADLQINGPLYVADNQEKARVVLETQNGQNGTISGNFITFDYAQAGNSSIGEYLNYVADNLIFANGGSIDLLLRDWENLRTNNPSAYVQLTNELTGELHDSMRKIQLIGITNRMQSLALQLRPENSRRHNYRTIRGQICSTSGTSGWMSGFGSFGKVKSDNAASGFDYQNFGGIAAIEKNSAAGTRLGLFYSYGHSTTDTNSTIGNGSISDHLFGLYFKMNDRFGYGIATLGYGFSDYSTERFAAGEKIDGAYNGEIFPLYFERGVSYTKACILFQPYIGFQYVHLTQDAFSETTQLAIGGWTYPVRKTDSLRSILGLRGSRQFGTLRLDLAFNWTHEYLDVENGYAHAFSVFGAELGKNWLSFGTDAEWHIRHNMSVFAGYDYQWNKQLSLHGIEFGLRFVR